MIRSFLIVSFLCCYIFCANASTEKKIAVVQFVEVSSLALNKKGITDVLDQHHIKYDYFNAQGQVNIARQIASKVFSSDYDAVITITTPVTQVFKHARGSSSMPIIFSAVTDPYAAKIVTNDSYIGNKKIVGVTDNLHVEHVFALIEKIFAPKRVGLIYNPAEQNSIITINLIKEKFGNKFELYEAAVINTSMVRDAANKFVGKVDVVYSPLDSTILATMNIVSKALTPYNIPIIASDPETIKKGASMAVGFSQYDVGREAALKYIEILNAGDDEKLLSKIIISTPKDHKVEFNEEQLRKMGITIPKTY